MRRHSVIYGLLGVLIGIVIGVNLAPLFADGAMSAFPRPRMFAGFGIPELIIFLVITFWIGFWALLIRGLFWGWTWGRGRYYHGRLEDLPADFDDWHRRAHERMGAAPADHSAGRG